MAYKRISPTPIAEGGTNTTSLTNTDGVVYYDGSKLATTTVGSSTQVLTSNGTGVAPTFQAAGVSSGVSSITGDTGSALTGALTLTGGTSGGTFAGSGTTLTLSFAELNLPNTTNTPTGYIGWGGNVYIHNFGSQATRTNTFVGLNSGNFTNSSATANNSGFGSNTLNGLTSGTNNLALGSDALKFLTTGSTNVAAGVGAMSSSSSTTMSNCSAIGYNALQNVTGSGNIGVGSGAASSLTSGVNNTCIGFGVASAYTSSESYNIIVGANVTGTAAESHTIRIGQSGSGTDQQNQCFVGGINGIVVTGTAVLVASNDQLGVAVSSQKFKTDIQDMGSTDVLNLRPVTFLWNKDSAPGLADASDERQFGLIAEEVYKIMPQLVVLDPDGKPFSVRYEDLPVLLLNELQNLKKEIEALS